jgi:hypothetical protein
MFNITGTAAANNTTTVLLRNLNTLLHDKKALAASITADDVGIYAETGLGHIIVKDNCVITNGSCAVVVAGYNATGDSRILTVDKLATSNQTYHFINVYNSSEYAITNSDFRNGWFEGIGGNATFPNVRGYIIGNTLVMRDDALDSG